MTSRTNLLRIVDMCVQRSATTFSLYKVDHEELNIYRQGGITYKSPIDVCAIHSSVLDTDLESKIGKVSQNTAFLTFSPLHLQQVLPSYDEGQWVVENDVCHIQNVQYKVSEVIRAGIVSGGPCTHVVRLIMYPDDIKVVA